MCFLSTLVVGRNMIRRKYQTESIRLSSKMIFPADRQYWWAETLVPSHMFVNAVDETAGTRHAP